MAIFDEDGNFIKELIVGSRLSAPWGITLAPPSFGRFGSHLLVGNFSFLHSEINAFDPINGKLRGTLRIDAGTNGPGGLWTIAFGGGGSNGVLMSSISRKAPEHECEDRRSGWFVCRASFASSQNTKFQHGESFISHLGK